MRTRKGNSNTKNVFQRVFEFEELFDEILKSPKKNSGTPS